MLSQTNEKEKTRRQTKHEDKLVKSQRQNTKERVKGFCKGLPLVCCD